MASDGKIIIETSLDTKGFEKDVDNASKKVADDLGKGTDKVMKQAETSINNVGKAFKNLDGSKIAKQLENVGKSITNTSSKIDLQKKKLAELQKAYDSATDTKSKNKIQEQMLNAESSIIKLESQLDKLNNKKIKLNFDKNALNELDGEFTSASMSATKSLDKIEKKAQETGASVRKSMGSISIGEGIVKVGNSISSVGNTLTSHVTLPLVAVGVAAAKVGMDFDSQMSRVKAISGSTGEEFNKLKGQALQLGKDTAFSSKQAAEGMENLASAGFTTNEIMTAMPGMLDLAASSGESLASSSDIAASAIRGFGLNASDAGHVADVLATNASKTNAQVADTGEALKYVATNAHAAGWSIEETTAAIGDLSNYGIKGTQAGTTLREMLVRLASPSKEAAGDMKTLGFNAFDSQGKMKSLSTIVGDYSKALQGKTDQQKQDYTATIFGQEAMSGMLALVQGGSGTLDDLTNSYKNSDGAAKDMATTMQDNTKSAIEQMTGSLETAAIKVEEDFAPAITAIANDIQDLANKFADLSPEQQEFYAKLLLGAVALGPVTKLVGGLTSNIGSLISVVLNVSKFLAPAAAAEAALAEGATATSVGLASLSAVALPVVAALATLGVVIAANNTMQDQLDDKLTSTTDNMSGWEKAINAMTGSTFKSKKELQDLGVEYKDFGDNISDNFKKKVEESTKTLNEFQLFLGKINLDGIIDESESNEFTSQINKMVNDSINAIKSKQSESNKALSDLFKLDDNTIDATEQAVLDSISKGFDTQINEENKLKDEILAIKKKAVDEKRALNDQEIKDIQTKNEKIKEIELEAVGGTAEEKAYSKNEFSARVDKGSTKDNAALLQEKKKQLDEENIQIQASYGAKLEMLKLNIAEQKKIESDANSTEEQKATAQAEETNAQAEYDKFAEIKEKKTKLKSDEWREYIAILKAKNPEALALINEYSGEELNKADLDSQKLLKSMKQEYSGLDKITESGTYKLRNNYSNAMEDISVTVDETTKEITGAYDEGIGKAGGYTAEMTNDAVKLGQAHMELEKTCQTAIDNLTKAHIDSSGKITNAAGETVGSLEQITTAEDGTVTGIMNINGTPIEIKTNADGTITNMDEVTTAIGNIPKENEVDFSSNSNEIKTEAADLKEKVESVPKENTIWFELKKKGGEFLEWVAKERSILEPNENKYTGTNVLKTGLSHVNEHGYETANNSNVKMLDSGLAFLIGHHYSGGDGINDHMTTVNEMNSDITKKVNYSFGKVTSTLISALSGQSNLLNSIANNTSETVVNGQKGNQLNEKLANGLIDKMRSTGGNSFGKLQSQLDAATVENERVSNLSVDDNKAYASAKAEQDRINDMTEDAKKRLGDEEYKRQKKASDDAVDLAKKTAELDITIAKDSAKKKEEIAKGNQEKLTKLAEATQTAIKAQLEEEKAAAEKVVNDELTAMETAYNKKVDKIESTLKSKTANIDKQISALEQESTDTSRDDTRTEANNNINMLTTKMNNTASIADKRAIALQIKDAKGSLSKQENEWGIEDEKAALEKEKTLLEEKAENKKKNLEKEYNTQKEAKEKELKSTDKYYDKLLETDSLNAQTRYTMLTSSNDNLVKLLNSYAPNWQDAGQSLADSLLTGLNSSKQSVQDAVEEITSMRSYKSDTESQEIKQFGGYASGTSSNPVAGFYKTNENNFEMSTSGDVAYVSKGAAISNNMQTKDYIQSEIKSQVLQMKNSILAEQAAMKNQILSSVYSSTNNSIVHNDNGLTLHVENLNNYSSSDTEQLANEMNTIRLKKEKS